MIKNVEKKFEKYLDYNIEGSLAKFGWGVGFVRFANVPEGEGREICFGNMHFTLI